MPHSIHTFLELVESKAFVGKEFVFRKDQPGRITTTSTATDTHNYDQQNALLFSEYTKEYPTGSVKGYLGFSNIVHGNDSGGNHNEIFLNFSDNNNDDGVGQYENLTEDQKEMYHHEMEPCFAKLHHGQDVVDLIEQRINENALEFVIQDVHILPKEDMVKFT